MATTKSTRYTAFFQLIQTPDSVITPPGPPSYERNWRFIQQISANLPPNASQKPVRVPARDVSEIFDYLRAVTQEGEHFSILAPFGPKPMSLAMCLFALQADFPVFYTQPMKYNPNYSSGKSMIGDIPEVYSYLIRHNGKDLYNLSV